MPRTTRREFIAAAAAASAGAALGGGEGRGAATPNYWCTWATQARTLAAYRASGEIKFPGDQGLVGARDNLGEQVLFRERGGWARTLYPESRSELNFLLDDGWDVGYGLTPADVMVRWSSTKRGSRPSAAPRQRASPRSSAG